jgi:hypothetical protein
VTGRFTSKDSWLGDYNRPLSLNRWNYTNGNPVNYTDPSGEAPQPDTERQACISSSQLDKVIQSVKENVCGMISELEDKNYLTDMPDTDHILVGHRSADDAHKFSTAYHILHDLVSIEDLRKTPIDVKGNVWYEEWWDVFYCGYQSQQTFPTDPPQVSSLAYLDYLVKKNASNLVKDETQLPFRPQNIIYTSFGFIQDVTYAMEGYPVGDPRRLPNVSLPGISKHVYGQAVDISIGATDKFKETGYTEIDEIASKYQLKRPYNKDDYVAYTDDEIREWWHFESFGFGR